MLAWFLYQPYLLLCYISHSIEKPMDVSRKWLHLVAFVNKWSPLPTSCLCVIHMLLLLSAFTLRYVPKNPQEVHIGSIFSPLNTEMPRAPAEKSKSLTLSVLPGNSWCECWGANLWPEVKGTTFIVETTCDLINFDKVRKSSRSAFSFRRLFSLKLVIL